MVQKPKAWVYYAPYLLHHSSATVFPGFLNASGCAVTEVQKQRLLNLTFRRGNRAAGFEFALPQNTPKSSAYAPSCEQWVRDGHSIL
jgi:hypothetical protein